MNLRRSKHKSRGKKKLKRKSWNISMKNPWKNKLREEKEKSNKNNKKTKNSKKPGNPNFPTWKIRKIVMTNSGKTFTRRMLMTWSAKWRRNKWGENRSWSKSWSLMRRPKQPWRTRTNSSIATPKSAWRSGSQTAKTCTQ